MADLHLAGEGVRATQLGLVAIVVAALWHQRPGARPRPRHRLERRLGQAWPAVERGLRTRPPVSDHAERFCARSSWLAPLSALGSLHPERLDGSCYLARPTLRAWRAQVLASFDTDGLSNGGTEAINMLIVKARRLAHGYRNSNKHRLRMLVAVSGTRTCRTASPR